MPATQIQESKNSFKNLMKECFKLFALQEGEEHPVEKFIKYIVDKVKRHKSIENNKQPISENDLDKPDAYKDDEKLLETARNIDVEQKDLSSLELPEQSEDVFESLFASILSDGSVSDEELESFLNSMPGSASQSVKALLEKLRALVRKAHEEAEKIEEEISERELQEEYAEHSKDEEGETQIVHLETFESILSDVKLDITPLAKSSESIQDEIVQIFEELEKELNGGHHAHHADNISRQDAAHVMPQQYIH